MYWEKYEGQSCTYDLNSCYPYVLQSPNNFYPINEGRYETIGMIPEKPLYGIYHCEIIHDKQVKFFNFNKDNYYTHLDIEIARKYGMFVNLIRDGNPNFLNYSQGLENGSYLFGHFVKDIYELKQNKIQGAKQILNVLWGALAETNYWRMKVDSDTERDLDDMDIRNIYVHNGNFHIKYIKHTEKYFKTNFGRIKPFVLAYARALMYNRYNKYEDEIIHIHTDSITMREPIEDNERTD